MNNDVAVEIVKVLLAAGADVNARGYQLDDGRVSSYQAIDALTSSTFSRSSGLTVPTDPIYIPTEAVSPCYLPLPVGPFGLTVPHRMKTRPLSLHCPTLVITLPLAQGGKTALSIASTNGVIKTVNLLLAAGADVNVKNDVGGWVGRQEACIIPSIRGPSHG